MVYYFILMQVKFFIYLFHSKDPWFHSFNKITLRITIKIKDMAIIINLFLFERILGIKNDISISKMRNIIETSKKLVENVVFFIDIWLKPHSKGVFLSFL